MVREISRVCWALDYETFYLFTLCSPLSLSPSPSLSSLSQWTHNNSDKLLALMSPEDRQTFDFDIRKMNWQIYIKRYCLGLKQYLLHEDLADLPKARQNIKRWTWGLHTCGEILMLCSLPSFPN